MKNNIEIWTDKVVFNIIPALLSSEPNIPLTADEINKALKKQD